VLAEEPTRIGRAQQDLLRQVHDHLRDELARIIVAVDEVAAGAADPGAARSMINGLAIRQNYWTLGSFCAAYCRMLSMHHGIEDSAMFPGLLERDPSLGPVVERLMADHELVADVLVELDATLVALVDGGSDVEAVRGRAQHLSDLLLPHLAYEEEQLLPVIGRLTERVV
jgi:hemerythrin HHE cation binding domain-containing protein